MVFNLLYDCENNIVENYSLVGSDSSNIDSLDFSNNIIDDEESNKENEFQQKKIAQYIINKDKQELISLVKNYIDKSNF
jgi:hypothetical protein